MEDTPGGKAAVTSGRHPLWFAGGSLLLHLLALVVLAFFFRSGLRLGPNLTAPGSPILSVSLLGAASHAAFARGGSAPAAPQATAPPAPMPPEAKSLASTKEESPSPVPVPTPDASAIPEKASTPTATEAAPSTEAGKGQGQGPGDATAKAEGDGASSSSPGGAAAENGTGALSLFGLEGAGHRIVLLFDVSDSVFLRSPGLFDSLYAEALARIDTLPPAVLFDLVVFKNGSLAWQPGPVPATEANRAGARKWLARIARQGVHFSVQGGTPGIPLYEGKGTRGDTALRQALGLAPDWVILITDGQWSIATENAKPSPLSPSDLLADLRSRGALPKIDVLLLTSRRTTEKETALPQTLAEESGGRLLPLSDEAVAAH